MVPWSTPTMTTTEAMQTQIDLVLYQQEAEPPNNFDKAEQIIKWIEKA